MDRVRKISSGAYATEDSASLAKTGRAIFFGSSVSPRRSLRSALPRRTRLVRSPMPGTSSKTRRDRRVAFRPMHVVIMGCGRVGSTLARILEGGGHSVAIIDRDAGAFRRLSTEFAGLRVTGIGFDRDTLVEAAIEKAEAFAAVSSGDNSNIISARVARETFGIENVVARIYDPARAEVYQRIGIPTVATARWTADQILRRLLPAGSEPEWRDPSGGIVLAEVHIGSSWVGRPVTELEAASHARIGFLTRLGEGLIPDANTVVQEGDLLHLLIPRGDVDRVNDAVSERPEEKAE